MQRFSRQREDKLIPPPCLVTGLEAIVAGVTWDEAAVRRVLPPGVVPVKEMTGGISIYRTSGGFGLGGAYTAAEMWVDLEGIDSSDGTKGRWMLAGVYGPSQQVTASFQEFYGLPIRNGSARHERNGNSVRAVGSYDGRNLVALSHTVEDLLAAGDRVVLRATGRGTHRGEFQGIAATNRSVEFGAIAVYRIESGRITEFWEQADLMKQLS